MNTYIKTHPFDPGTDECETVLDQLFQAYQEAHECDPPDIKNGFKQLDVFLEGLPLEDNNAVFNLACSLCTAYERKAFKEGIQYGAYLMRDLFVEGVQ